jgi:hypothetical protein
VNVDEENERRAARGEENRLSTRIRSAHLRSPEAAELVCNSVSYQTSCHWTASGKDLINLGHDWGPIHEVLKN